MAGFFGFFDYTKEGKGVRKDEPEKKRFPLFFELLFRKFWKLVQLNLLYLVTLIPVLIIYFFLSGIVSENLLAHIGQTVLESADMAAFYFELTLIIMALTVVFWGGGPVTAGFTYVLRNYARQEHAWVFGDFWEHTKSNFKQSIVVFVVDIAAFFLIYTSIFFYFSQGGMYTILAYLVCVFAFVYAAAHFYLYPMMVTFQLPLRSLYKNSFLFAVGRLPQNLLIAAIILAVFGVGISVSPPLLALLMALLFFSVFGFLTTYSIYPTLQKYMIINHDAKNKVE